MTLDAATDELVVGDGSGEVIRLARTTGEPAAVPGATTGMTPTVEMTCHRPDDGYQGHNRHRADDGH